MTSIRLTRACALTLTLAASALACTSTSTSETGSGSEAVTSDAPRPAVADGGRIIVRAASSDTSLCLVHEASGKLKLSQCNVGGEAKPGPDACALGGDGCWRVGKTEAWRSLLDRTDDGRIFADLVHLDGAHLSALPNPTTPENGVVKTATWKNTSFLFVDPESQTLQMPTEGIVSGYLTTVASGSKYGPPPSSWCLSVADKGGDKVLGLEFVSWFGPDPETGEESVDDYSKCATLTIEPAKQVYGPTPTGLDEASAD